MSRYQGVSLDKGLISRVDEAVKKDPFVVSRAEFIRRAIEHFLKRIWRKTMDDYKIKRGKYDDKYFVAVIMKDPTLIQPLVLGVDHFLNITDIKR